MPRDLKPVPNEVPAEEVEEGVRYLTLRGKRYRLEELTAAAFEECQRRATDEKGESIDNLILARLITLEGVTVDGKKLDPEKWVKEKYPVVDRVQLEMRRMHFIYLETDEERAERAEREKKGEAPND